MKFIIDDFDSSLCRQMDHRAMFHGLWSHTSGNPCETGCAWFNNGNCAGYKKLIHKKADDKKSLFSKKTNQQIADELMACGVSSMSKRQVSKLRKSGELAEMMEKHGI